MQDKIFLKEGDRWFERNLQSLRKIDDIVIFLIDLYNLYPSKVFELGSSNGYRLARIKEKFDCYVIGVEPSHKACFDGRKNFSLEMIRGVGSEIPIKDNVFDLVIVNSVFHWIDRQNLLKTVSELDRILKDGGFIIIGDFFPDYLYLKVRYHHLSDKHVFTYKQDYSKIFTFSGIYKKIATLTYDVSDKKLKTSIGRDYKFSVTLMQKNLNDYLEVELKK